MPKVFISYRRSDADADAGRIRDRLVDVLGDDEVFHDHEALEAGVPWQRQLEDALARTDVTLAVIGPGWLDAKAADGTRRLDDPKDHVAWEIARSIERGIRVIPVLVRQATLPAAQALPPSLQALPGYQGRWVRNDTFDADMAALVAAITGKPARWRRGKAIPAAATLVTALAVGAWVWQEQAPDRAAQPAHAVSAAPSPPSPVAPATPAPPEARSGLLGLRIRIDPPDAAPQRFLLSINEPVLIRKSQLPPPVSKGRGLVEVLEERALLPGRGERYDADVVREAISGTLDRSASHGRTSVCLQRSPQAPASDLKALLDCVEGERCTLAADNPGHFELCGGRTSGLAPRRGWSWLPLAHAQADAAQPAWIVPSLATLERQRAAGRAGAYTVVSIESPPLPALAAAREVSVALAVNGRTALIDGLPPDASAVPFDAAQGVRLRFALENLDFAGIERGHDRLDVALRFLDGKRVVREVPARLKYIALRDQPEPRPLGDATLGLRWTAAYVPGRAEDRFQIFVTSSENVDALVGAKTAFDAARLSLAAGSATWPLVAVVRPPLGDNRAWGLNVGLVQRSGQVRFTFDEAQSTQVCRRLAELAARGSPHVRSDAYRRSVDNTRQYALCSQLSRG